MASTRLAHLTRHPTWGSDGRNDRTNQEALIYKHLLEKQKCILQSKKERDGAIPHYQTPLSLPNVSWKSFMSNSEKHFFSLTFSLLYPTRWKETLFAPGRQWPYLQPRSSSLEGGLLWEHSQSGERQFRRNNEQAKGVST